MRRASFYSESDASVLIFAMYCLIDRVGLYDGSPCLVVQYRSTELSDTYGISYLSELTDLLVV